jgi:hypothetical protein
MRDQSKKSSRQEGLALCIEAIGHRVGPGEATKFSEDDAQLARYVAGIDEEVIIARATRDCVLKRSP